MLKTLKNISTAERLEIGEEYRQGGETSVLATHHGTSPYVINQVVYTLRKSGVIIPLRKGLAKNDRTLPDLLVLPKEKRKHWKISDKKEAYKLYRDGNIGDVMREFSTSKHIAYYLMHEGRKALGVKGKRYSHAVPDVQTKDNLTSPVTVEWGVFTLGVLVGVLCLSLAIF